MEMRRRGRGSHTPLPSPFTSSNLHCLPHSPTIQAKYKFKGKFEKIKVYMKLVPSIHTRPTLHSLTQQNPAREARLVNLFISAAEIARTG